MYAAGIGDVMSLAGQDLLHSSDRIVREELVDLSMCPNNGYTYGALKQAFVNWAEKHPEKWTEFADLGVIIALRETWPCQ
jgi:hypothetical protein